MKTYLLLLALLIPLVITSCSKDDDPVNSTKEYTVRYEATCVDVENYDIKVRYAIKIEGVGLTTKEEIVSSPFKSKELKLNNGNMASITVDLVKKEGKNDGTTGVTTKVFVNDALIKEDTGKYSAFASALLLDN